MAIPFFKWYYNSNTGAVVELPEQVGYFQLKSGLGWHGPFNSKQEALSYYDRNKAGNAGWKAPTGVSGNISNAIDTTKDKLGSLDLGAWFLRIGEVLLGLVLVGVGVAKLTGTQNLISAVAKVPI